MPLKHRFIACLALLTVIAACSVLKKEDPEKEIRLFISRFEKSLVLPDQEILKQFESSQSHQALLAAIALLQNKDLEYISCRPDFTKTTVSFDELGARASIEVDLRTEGLESQRNRKSSFTLWLKPKQNSFVIARLEAEELYNAFISLKSSIEWDVSQKEQLMARAPIFEKAQALQEEYDSVVWFTEYNEKLYFYVVNGTWDVEQFRGGKKQPVYNYKMGLLDESGNVIVPVEFDLVGTIGILQDSLVEVTRDGKNGLYDLSGKEIVSPQYTMFVPYQMDSVALIVKQDTSFGWLDSDYAYQAGFPTIEAEQHIANYNFLPEQYKFSAEDQSICQVPNEEYFGYGALVPPSYWASTGLFSPVITGIVIDGYARYAYIEYIETKKTFFENISENLSAVITTVRERFLEGREEFYTRHQLMLVDSNRDTLTISDDIYGNGEFEIKRIGNLLEVKCQVDDESYYYEEMDEETDFNIPRYAYYELQEDMSMVPVKSVRRFNFTEHVMLDSSYLTGEFQFYNPKIEKVETVSFLRNATLHEMRFEILAANGYKFHDPLLAARFLNYKWYDPQYETYQELEEVLNDIDTHNLAFLEKILGPFQEGISI